MLRGDGGWDISAPLNTQMSLNKPGGVVLLTGWAFPGEGPKGSVVVPWEEGREALFPIPRPGTQVPVQGEDMKHLKRLGLITSLAATALMALAGVASASSEFRSGGTTYTSTIEAQSSNISLSGPFTTINCSGTFAAKVEKHGVLYDAGGKFSSLTFTGCPLKVLKAGSFDSDGTGGGNGDFQWFGTELTGETSVGHCIWTTSATQMGTITGNNSTNAVIDMSPGEIPRTGGSFFCGSVGYLTGTWTVTTPGTLSVT